MSAYEKVCETLKDLGISYEVAQHPPAMTTEEADRYIEGRAGVRTKTLFLCNKKSTAYYLVVMDDKKRLDLKGLEEILGAKGLHFGSPEKLALKMGLTPGCVSPFGLLNDADHQIQVYLDSEILSELPLTFHPNDNTKTIFLSVDDMRRFLEALGYDYTVVDL